MLICVGRQNNVEGNSDFERLQPIRVTNIAEIRLFAAEDAISHEYDDRVLLSFIPDNLGLITGLQAFGEYIRDTATVNINDSDSKRCSLCLALSFRHAALGSQCRSFVIVVGATNSLMIARR